MKDRISLRVYLKDFEDYMMTHYGMRILDMKKKSANPRRPKRKERFALLR